MRFTATYANSQNGGQDSSRTEVIATARAVRNAIGLSARRTDIGCFNEIREAEDKEDVLRGMGRSYRVRHLITPNPIFYRNLKWTVAGVERRAFHPADGRVPTPKRWLTYAALQGRFNWHPQIDVVCIHFINGAWNVEHIDSRKERRTLWIASDHLLADFIDGLVKLGRNVLLIGDFNKVDVGKYSKQWVWVHNRGILKMGYHPAPGWKWEVLDKASVEINSTDKPVLGATFKVTKKR